MFNRHNEARLIPLSVIPVSLLVDIPASLFLFPFHCWACSLGPEPCSITRFTVGRSLSVSPTTRFTVGHTLHTRFTGGHTLGYSPCLPINLDFPDIPGRTKRCQINIPGLLEVAVLAG